MVVKSFGRSTVNGPKFKFICSSRFSMTFSYSFALCFLTLKADCLLSFFFFAFDWRARHLRAYSAAFLRRSSPFGVLAVRCLHFRLASGDVAPLFLVFSF